MDGRNSRMETTLGTLTMIFSGWNKLMSKVTRNYSIMYSFEPDQMSIGSAQSKELTSQNVFYIQTSLLYTNENRQRMLRVHNYGVRTSKDLTDVYSHIDYQTLLTSMMRKKLSGFVSQLPLIDIQLEIINDLKKMFKGISAQTSSDYQSTILPFIALGFLGILKCSIFQAHYINNCKLIS